MTATADNPWLVIDATKPLGNGLRPNNGLEPTRYARGTRGALGLVVVLVSVVRLAWPARGSTLTVRRCV